ncbi:hypothetical protein KAJ87_00905 [Candidatus Pacearchaeota archaeon]|nr:hypothetical protein [Candidatus Pacearchaeota archaeon]
MAKRKKRVDESQIINSAVEEGVNTILGRHPRFKENQEYILKHIDLKKIKNKIQDLYENLEEKGIESDKKRSEYIHNEIADYVATGSAFDEAGKGTILKSGLEEKAKSGFFKGLFARGTLKGEKYLDNVLDSFQDLYLLFKKGDYSQRMPEVAEAVTSVYDMGFLDPAVDVLKHYGLINEGKYNNLKKSIRNKTKKGAESVVSGIEKYATYQKVAASIFGIFGIGLLILSGAKITGAVIGNFFNSAIGLIGGFLTLISLILFLKVSKKKRK